MINFVEGVATQSHPVERRARKKLRIFLLTSKKGSSSHIFFSSHSVRYAKLNSVSPERQLLNIIITLYEQAPFFNIDVVRIPNEIWDSKCRKNNWCHKWTRRDSFSFVVIIQAECDSSAEKTLIQVSDIGGLRRKFSLLWLAITRNGLCDRSHQGYKTKI